MRHRLVGIIKLSDRQHAAQLPRSDYIFWTRALFRLQVARTPELALEDLHRARTLSPAYAPAYECIGLAHMMMGDLGAADENLEKAMAMSETDPLWPQRAFMLAVVQFCHDRPDAADATIAKAIQLRPKQREFLVLQAECRRRDGREAEAREIDERIGRLPREPSIFAPRPPLPDGYEWVQELLAPSLLEVES